MQRGGCNETRKRHTQIKQEQKQSTLKSFMHFMWDVQNWRVMCGKPKRLDRDLVLPWSNICSRSSFPLSRLWRDWNVSISLLLPSRQTLQNVPHLTFVGSNEIITRSAFKIEFCIFFGRRMKMMPLGEAWSEDTSDSKNTGSSIIRQCWVFRTAFLYGKFTHV
jgi:hypothetical protein